MSITVERFEHSIIRHCIIMMWLEQKLCYRRILLLRLLLYAIVFSMLLLYAIVFSLLLLYRDGSDKITVRQKNVHPDSGLHFLSFNEEKWEKSWDRVDSKSLFVVVVLELNFKKGTRV